MDTIDFVDMMDITDLDDLASIGQQNRVRVDPFDYYNTHEFKEKYKFSKRFAQTIVDIVKDDLSTETRGGTIKPRIQVVSALRRWTQNEAQDDSGVLHGISQQAVSNICRNLSEAIARKADLFVNMPSVVEEQEDTMRDFRAIANFPNVIGAIDCTHIHVKRVPGETSEEYADKKGFYSLSVQVVCDANLRIRDIATRCLGNVNDSRIFNISPIKVRFQNGEFSGRLLGDNGYVCTPYLFTPVLSPNTEREEAYNWAHINTRMNTIEKCFTLWKERFKCLHGMHTKLSTANTTIVALAVLHNIAIDMNEQIDIQGVHNRPWRQPAMDTAEGSIARRDFVNENFQFVN